MEIEARISDTGLQMIEDRASRAGDKELANLARRAIAGEAWAREMCDEMASTSLRSQLQQEAA